ncbi:MAG TPA: NUDIX hydrolase [Holophaga sp.]|nr:NUDIX hydrolase [Holophaga sp.]
MTWELTVAAVIERDGRFLVVEETDRVNPARVFNQPAGHVEPGEPLLDALVREVREETGLAFEPQAFIGFYQLRARNGKDYARACFSGCVPKGIDPSPQDPDILACHWLTRDEIAQRPRSGIVLDAIDDYRAGRRWPLEAVNHFRSDRDIPKG